MFAGPAARGRKLFRARPLVLPAVTARVAFPPLNNTRALHSSRFLGHGAPPYHFPLLHAFHSLPSCQWNSKYDAAWGTRNCPSNLRTKGNANSLTIQMLRVVCYHSYREGLNRIKRWPCHILGYLRMVVGSPEVTLDYLWFPMQNHTKGSFHDAYVSLICRKSLMTRLINFYSHGSVHEYKISSWYLKCFADLRATYLLAPT